MEDELILYLNKMNKTKKYDKDNIDEFVMSQKDIDYKTLLILIRCY